MHVEASNPHDIDVAFSEMAREKAQAAIVMRDPFFNQQRRQIAQLAIKHRIASVLGNRDLVDAGGLMSYGANTPDMWRRAATYIDKIFKGAKPTDLPVELPTKFELVINRKTAKLLGLFIPQSILISADEVIE
jgi:putative ABC transport system substrate-binding protein